MSRLLLKESVLQTTPRLEEPNRSEEGGAQAPPRRRARSAFSFSRSHSLARCRAGHRRQAGVAPRASARSSRRIPDGKLPRTKIFECVPALPVSPSKRTLMASSGQWEGRWDVVLGSAQSPDRSTDSDVIDLSTLVNAYAALLFRVAHSILHNRAESEDLDHPRRHRAGRQPDRPGDHLSAQPGQTSDARRDRHSPQHPPHRHRSRYRTAEVDLNRTTAPRPTPGPQTAVRVGHLRFQLSIPSRSAFGRLRNLWVPHISFFEMWVCRIPPQTTLPAARILPHQTDLDDPFLPQIQ